MARTGQARIGQTLTLPRMNAHRLVIVAAALTTLVAAALGTTFAVFSGQALPRAVRVTLAAATGTAVNFSGAMTAGQAGQYTTLLRRQMGAALDGVPFAFYQARWSDPLGFTSGSGPAASAGGNVPIAEAAALTGLSAHAVLTAGTWPGSPGQAGAGRPAPPVPAALPDAAAGLLHVRPGGTLTLRDRVSGRLARFRITGLYRPRQAAGAAAAYWGLNQIGASGASTSSGYTTYGPLAVSPAAFGASGPLTVGSATWVVQPEAAAIPASRLGPVAARLTALRQSVQSPATLPSLTVTTALPAVLTGTQSDLRVARSLLAVCAVLVALLAAAALLVVARLLAGQREGESAMLVSRGATRWQLTRLTLAEAVPLCVVAAAVGGLAGVVLARARTGAGPVPLTAAVASAWPVAAVVAAGAVLILLAPVLRTVNPGTARVRRGRQAALAGFSRAGLDVALIVLAVLAGLELRRYSAVSAGGAGGSGVDPVLVAAPALALAGGAVAALRLLPLGGKAGDRLAARSRRLTAALASWQISRQPIRQGGAVLLIVLAVATAGLVLAQRDSWTRSDHDQAAFTAGADVRVQPAEPLTAGQAGQLSQTPGVRRAMPVVSSPASIGSGETVALDVRQAAAVTLLRADQLPRAASPLFATITPAGPAAGLALPGHPVRVAIAASIGPASLPLAPVTVTVTVQDATGDAFSLPAGTLPADARAHTLTAAVPGGGAVYPLRVTAITAAYTLPDRAAADRAAAVFSVTSLSGGPGQAPVAGTALSRWQAQASSPELAGAQAEFPGVNGPVLLPAVAGLTAASGGTRVTFQAGYGQIDGDSAAEPTLPVTGQLTLTAAHRSATPIPGLATRGYLTANHAAVGSVVQAGIGGTNLAVKIVGAVASFPTVPLSGGAVIVDLAAVQDRLASRSLPPVQASQWWLATAGGRSPPQLAGRLPAGASVTSASALTEGLLNDPVSAVPRHALLAVALAAALLAITGFVVSIAAGVRQRRAENALLAALGVPPGAAARQLSLENLMLSVPSALAGLALGAVLAELLVPAITLTTTATIPVPPVLIEFSWPLTVTLAAVVAIAPVLAAAVTLARRPDPAAALRTAEAT
jgi:FtsX-like permease family